MQLLNKNTDYAIRALIYLAQRRKVFTSSREISDNGNIPLQFVRRILQDLKQANFLDSKEGATGGVKLIKDPSVISLTAIIELFQGKVQISACMFRNKICPNRSECVLRNRILSIEQKMILEFQALTIQTLIDDMEIGNEKKNN